MSVKVTTKMRDVPTTVVVDRVVKCNMCGCEAYAVKDTYDMYSSPQQGELVAGEFLQIEYRGGYHNWVVGDMCHVEFHLCQTCVGNLIDNLKEKPDVDNGIRRIKWEEWKNIRPKWRH